MSLLGAADFRRIAADIGLRPTKQRGQNFVIDANTVRRIVRTSGVGPEDVVVEIGPGLGSLTLELGDGGARSRGTRTKKPNKQATTPEETSLKGAGVRVEVQLRWGTSTRAREARPVPRRRVCNRPYNLGTGPPAFSSGSTLGACWMVP